MPDLILDEFAECISNDKLFHQIAQELIDTVQKKKPSKSQIEKLLRKTRDENTKSES